MIGNIHLKQAIKGMWLKTLLLCLLLFAFEMLFPILGTSAQIQGNIIRDMKDVPEVMRVFVGEGFMEAMLKYGIIALGYIHPFMFVLFILFIFISTSQIVTSEIHSGTIGFTLGKAVSRSRIFFNLAVVIYIGLGLLALSAYSSSTLGILLFHSPRLTTEPFAAVAWNLYLLMVFVAGYVAIFAALSDSGRKLYTLGGVTLLLFYLLNMAAMIWKWLDYLSPVNPFSYYNPIQILMGSRVTSTQSAAILLVSAIMFTVAARIFARRDIAAG